ncbi:YciI family protein [Gallibacterium anatis]|uniref:YciI family protein n=1 Tax=Gallibacterium anatis TaxID=750 RepID=A0AAX3XG23_9PAST|nr:YciI family protein [Gallibacterium anatis]MDK9429854.1 YciI family protein [Gallibacterium anatis]WIM80350.1 YciI family protein [Gallibacterium anatis]
MFLVQISLAPSDAVSALLDGHRAWLKQYAEEGNFLLFGPYDNHQGGLILAQADSEEALQSILAEDVFYHNGLADYQIIAFSAKFINIESLQVQIV